MKLLRRIIVLSIILSVMIWVEAIIRCEILTSRYADLEMMDVCLNYVHADKESEGSKIKILHKGTRVVEVYLIEKQEGKFIAGHVFEMMFDTDKSSWNILTWDTEWSGPHHGNADEYVWPYILDTFLYAQLLI